MVVPLGKPLYKVDSDYQPLRYFHFALSNISSLFGFHDISSNCLSDKGELTVEAKRILLSYRCKVTKNISEHKGFNGL